MSPRFTSLLSVGMFFMNFEWVEIDSKEFRNSRVYQHLYVLINSAKFRQLVHANRKVHNSELKVTAPPLESDGNPALDILVGKDKKQSQLLEYGIRHIIKTFELKPGWFYFLMSYIMTNRINYLDLRGVTHVMIPVREAPETGNLYYRPSSNTKVSRRERVRMNQIIDRKVNHAAEQDQYTIYHSRPDLGVNRGDIQMDIYSSGNVKLHTNLKRDIFISNLRYSHKHTYKHISDKVYDEFNEWIEQPDIGKIVRKMESDYHIVSPITF